jgi:Na+-transporting NADH:ubiquinone oxidoreductase subunit NqrB
LLLPLYNRRQTVGESILRPSFAAIVLNLAAIEPRGRHIRSLEEAPMRGALLSDARHYQILALSLLLAYSMTALDFGSAPLPSVIAIASAVLTQIVCTRLAGQAKLDLRSPLISGLSLSLLLRADAPWVFAAAGIIAIASKFVLRHAGKHIWNPAGIAIVAMLFGTNHAWISPGIWGTEIWFAALLGLLALIVLTAAARADIALFFLGTHAALLFARAAWLGDPLAIPLHQLETGALLIFAFFMITDPKTTPNARIARFILALGVAGLAHYLAFFGEMRPALYLSLALLSPLVPLLDRLFPAQRFTWLPQTAKGTPA